MAFFQNFKMLASSMYEPTVNILNIEIGFHGIIGISVNRHLADGVPPYVRARESCCPKRILFSGPTRVAPVFSHRRMYTGVQVYISIYVFKKH